MQKYFIFRCLTTILFEAKINMVPLYGHISTYIDMQFNNIPEMLSAAAERWPSNPAVRFTGDEPVNYKDQLALAEAISAMLIAEGIVKGDRVAILSHNMPQWSQAYFGISATGAVAVPLMPDFKSHEVEQILQHSGAKIVFASRQLEANVPSHIKKFILEELDQTAFNAEQPFHFGDVGITLEDLASIIYTSGTTGDPKGVMLTHGNIIFTVGKSALIQPIIPEDRFLSVLPLSHIYEFSLGLMLPVMFGAGITYLRKPPTAPVLLPALQEVKPTIMLTVPLLIEKVYWKSVFPKLNSSLITATLHRLPLTRKLLHRIAAKKVYQTFGGCLKFYGIGGSKLDPRVELFLRDGKFPYAIGYGLTETSPMLAGGSPGTFAFQSTGPAMEEVELRLHEVNPETGFGEIQARGKNVMQGYYLSPEQTAEVFEEDGWFKTGDLGYFDKKGHLHIKGRIKSTIIGANGKNIFPEEIENVINSLKFVKESLVTESNGRLVGLIHLDYEAIDQHFQQMRDDAATAIRDKVSQILHDIHQHVNNHVNKFSRLQQVVEQTTPFERTPTQKIKRFLYK
jgi:long-chain acyl-CoA synthetase